MSLSLFGYFGVREIACSSVCDLLILVLTCSLAVESYAQRVSLPASGKDRPHPRSPQQFEATLPSTKAAAVSDLEERPWLPFHQSISTCWADDLPSVLLGQDFVACVFARISGSMQ